MATRQRRSDESENDRYDRELLELLNEVRVAMPGVQVLFGFLLAVPFQQGFEQTTAFQRDVYVVTLMCAALTTIFLVAPVAYHRIMFRRHDKPTLIETGNLSLAIGLFFLAVSMSCAVLLVTDLLFRPPTVIVLTASIALLFTILWFGIAFARRVSGQQSRDDVG